MTFSLYSLLTTILWTSLLSIFIFLCRRSITFIQYFGISAVSMIFMACMIRLLIPLEFSFTKEIATPKLLNSVCQVFQSTPIQEVSIASMLTILWVFVALVLFIRLVIRYVIYIKKLSALSSHTSEQIDKVAKDIFDARDIGKLKIILYPYISVPMICGFRKGIILLPDIEYTDQELKFILKHEYTHFKNKDAYVRLVIDIFCTCFWWNPFIYFMKLDLDNILEIKCDMDVVKENRPEEVIVYSEMLIRFLKERANKKVPFCTCEFSNDNAIVQRFQLLFQPKPNQRTQKQLSRLVAVALCSTLVSSYNVYISISIHTSNWWCDR